MLIKKFEEIVEKYGNNAAIKDENNCMNYLELNKKCNKIANKIVSLSKETKTVMLLLEHGIDGAVSIMAALKAEKIYVPIYPNYPENRIEDILIDSEAKIIVTNSKNYNLAQKIAGNIKEEIAIINIENIEDSISNENPVVNNSDKNGGAYIIYTSGSTGKPKGVLQSRKSLLFYTENYIKVLNITEKDKFTYVSSFCHDGTVEDVFPAFLSGACLYPLDLKKINSSNEISEWLIKEKITVYHSVPSVFRFFAATLTDEKFEELRLIVMGAEALREHDLHIIRTFFPKASLEHMYGQTEASVNTMGTVNLNGTASEITLGKEFDGVKLIILNEKNEIAAKNEIGEIYVASDYLATEYWNNKIETEKAFAIDERFGRVYKSGDLGFYSDNGMVKFAGRKDFQVKIRGFRVELGEIETQIMKYKGIKQAVVIDRGEAENKFLASFLVLNENIDTEDLRGNIQSKLPEYMVPSKFIVMDKLPLTLSNKVDRKYLKTIEIKEEAVFEEAKDELQKTLVKLFAKIVKVENVGINHDFFTLGGNSLSALELITEAKKYGINLKYEDIYNYKSIKEISKYLSESCEEIQLIEIKEANEESNENKNEFRMLSEINPYQDKYTIREIDCFYRPVAMLHKYYKEEYYNLFLMYFNYYTCYTEDGYFEENRYVANEEPNSSFMRFYDDILKDKFGLEFIKTVFENKESFHDQLQSTINEKCAVLIGMDLYHLNYSSIYLEKHQGHYFIIKGYNKKKKIYYILDNTHVKGGVTTEYDEFVVSFEDLYNMSVNFFEMLYPKSKIKYFHSLKKISAKNEFNYIKGLKDIRELYERVENGSTKIKYLEKEVIAELAENKNMDKCVETVGRINWRDTYHKILFETLYLYLNEADVKKLEEKYNQIKENWHNVVMKTLGILGEGKFEFESLKNEIEENINLEEQFRKMYLKIVSCDFLNKKIKELEELGKNRKFIEKNNNKADIKIEENIIEIALKSNQNYDTWIMKDNSPQLLIYTAENSDFVLETNHSIVRDENIRSHFPGTNSGIILKLGNGHRYMFGVTSEQALTIFKTENTEKPELYNEMKSFKNYFLKIKKEGKNITFFSKEQDNNWQEIYSIKEETVIEAFGLFSRAWETVNYKVKFEDTNYSVF